MDIQSAIPANTNQLIVKSAQLNLSRLFIGQILNASVVGKKSSNSFILQIGSQQIEAKSTENKTLNIGEQLKLIVTKQDNPTTLRVIQHDPKILTQEAKQQLLRENIPKQADLEKLTTVLSQASKNIKESIKNLPIPVEQQFKKLIEHLPTKHNLNTEAGLKTAIKNSGVFLEARLLTEAINKEGSKLNMLFKISNQASQKVSRQLLNPNLNQSLSQSQHLNIAKDLKGNLLQLTDVINKVKQSTQLHKFNDAISLKHIQASFIKAANKNNAMSKETSANGGNLALKAEAETVSKLIESFVARIEVNQSKAIVTHDNQSPLWSIEIPVKDKKDFDSLKLNIQADKDSKKNTEKQQLWMTDLRITFENIGVLSAKLSILDKEINATLWSDNETLSNLIDANLPILNKKIENQGLTTGKITCLKETPIEKEKSYVNHNLINITI